MKTFYLAFEITPTVENEYHDVIEGGIAHCWIAEDNPLSVYVKAKFFTEKANWKIESIETQPVEVAEENFLEREDGLQQYFKAQKEKIAITYLVWARDETLITEPTILHFKSSHQFNANEFLKKNKQLSQKGRCLHYDSGRSCNEIINAHSIQKNQSLSAIADNGKVYVVSSYFGDLKNNHGNITYKKRGIEKEVSIFRGFCKQHDNELFKPIDDFPLIPTKQQVFLYAYRSLCRELFVKENSLDSINSQIGCAPHNTAVKQYLNAHKRGTEFGLNNLKIHKQRFDNSLKNDSYLDIKYVIFISKQKPCIAFSGLLYPNFDFTGNQLQDLSNHENNLELITFFSAPMNNNEWGVVFAWHKSSSNVCVDFMRSLATMMYDKNKLGDLLFRLVISNCENHAISPQWWEKLSTKHQEKISLRISSMVDDMSIIEPDYLKKGLEGIIDWEFENVISEMDDSIIKNFINRFVMTVHRLGRAIAESNKK
ncbi:MAG: hypothetical protein M0Q44_22225 [Methylobacter sp.]|jgi:hypothetical protein|nr:hypothetical protein [Methylobacter sp.]